MFFSVYVIVKVLNLFYKSTLYCDFPLLNTYYKSYNETLYVYFSDYYYFSLKAE